MPLPHEPVPAIHKAAAENRYRIGWHAVQHMFEEGFDTANLLETLEGKLVVLEEYEEDGRVLVSGAFRVLKRQGVRYTSFVISRTRSPLTS
jgi:hypothetical protein